MDQYNPFVVRYHRNHGGKVLFYTYNNELYAPTFPEEWVKDFKPNTGPANCSDCGTFGAWNAAFIGYCVKCAKKYNGERGNGFIFFGIEEKEKEKEKGENKNSAFNTYLKDVDLDEIGDTEICDTAALMDEIKSYEPGYQFCQEDEEEEEEEDEKVEWSIDRDADSIGIFGIHFDGGDDSN